MSERIWVDDVDIKGRILRRTDMAVLFSPEDGSTDPIWLPRGQIAEVLVTNNLVMVTLPEWLARQKGLF